MGDLATEFERYAGWAADVTPLYETLASAVAADQRLLDIAAATPEGQPAPQLLLAAVHSLLLDDDSHPLATFCPTCHREDVATVDGDPVSHFRDFCRTHEDELRDRIASRRVQTNDVGRSAILLPAFTHVDRWTESDGLAVIELGASAGLNLNWDRYRYCYRRTTSSDGDDGQRAGDIGQRTSDDVQRVGDANSSVTITSEVRGGGALPLPASVPRVEWRVGVDLDPLDPTDPDDARWLHALVHPDQLDRHRRLDSALKVARETQPPVREGGALEDLPRLLGAAPPDSALVVYSTHFLYQLPTEAVNRIRSILAAHSRYRPVDWLSIDPEGDLGSPMYRRVAFREGDATAERLGQFESYGKWLRWLRA